MCRYWLYLEIEYQVGDGNNHAVLNESGQVSHCGKDIVVSVGDFFYYLLMLCIYYSSVMCFNGLEQQFDCGLDKFINFLRRFCVEQGPFGRVVKFVAAKK